MLLQQLVNGLMLGAAYALVAIGYSLVFGVLKLVHLAHGEVFMVGAFVGLQTALWLDVGPVVALVAAAIGGAILGMIFEIVAFRRIPTTRGHFLPPIVCTLSAALVPPEV